jgi:hypothetical protein
MKLIVFYIAFVIAGGFADYLLGLFVEYEWGSNVSLIVFLLLYFFFLWVSWPLAVWMTTPRCKRPMRSVSPQWWQTGPLGHNRAST